MPVYSNRFSLSLKTQETFREQPDAQKNNIRSSTTETQTTCKSVVVYTCKERVYTQLLYQPLHIYKIYKIYTLKH